MTHPPSKKKGWRAGWPLDMTFFVLSTNPRAGRRYGAGHHRHLFLPTEVDPAGPFPEHAHIQIVFCLKHHHLLVSSAHLYYYYVESKAAASTTTRTQREWTSSSTTNQSPRSLFGTRQSSSSRTATVTSSIDLILVWIASDVGSIALGLPGLGTLLLGRFSLDTSNIPTNVQAAGQATPSNFFDVVATGAVLLNGLGKLHVDAVLA
jgi:hypothetical protein